MEGKNESLNANDNSIKILDIKSNFKKARKISPSNFAEQGKKKKSVVFLEPPKELKYPNIKKTQIMGNPNKIFTPNFQTEIGHSKRRKSKNNVKSSKVKSARNHSIKKLPTQKTKVVNINKHYYIPIITQFDTSTVISKKNENHSKKKKENSYSRINTRERNIRKIDFSDKIKKIEIKSSNKNLKEKKVIIKENDKYYIKDDEDNLLNKKEFIDDNCRIQLQKSYTMVKDKKDSNKSNKSQESGTKKLTDKNNVSELNKIKIENHERENNDEENNNIEKLEHNSNHNNNSSKDESINNKENNENKKEEKENNKCEEKQSNDDNLTNKINIHTKNSSVDETKKKGNKKYNDSLIKKLLCCLYG